MSKTRRRGRGRVAGPPSCARGRRRAARSIRADRGAVDASLAIERRYATRLASDATTRSGSRWVWIDARVGILGEQRVERPQMSGRLQHPALGRTPPLEILQLAPVRRVHPAHVGGRATLDSSASACVVVKIMLAKSCAVSATHSCGSRAPIGCIALKFGISRSTPGQVLLDRGDARVGLVGGALGRRMHVHHLPRHRHPVGGILRQQLVQDRRPGARQTDDEERPLDRARRRSRDARFRAATMRRRFSSSRARSRARDDAPEQRERGLALEAVEQDAERLAKPRRPRSRRARSGASRAPERTPHRVEQRQPGGAERPADAIQEPEPERTRAEGRGIGRALEHSGCER